MDSNRAGATGHKVGEVAAAAGLSVRALHHYEEIGLLTASGRSDGGHRVYSAADLERLYRIMRLRQLGLPLAEIARALDDPAWQLNAALAHHLADVDRRLEAATRLRRQLDRLLSSAGSEDQHGTESLLHIMEGMAMLDTNIQRRIGILVYRDLEGAYEHLVGVFGLGPGQLTRDDDGTAVHGEVQAGDGVIWLHPEAPDFGLASPKTLGAASGSTAVIVEDVDGHFRHAAERGADIVYEPVDQPYGYREYSARDPEGGLWSFMKPIG